MHIDMGTSKSKGFEATVARLADRALALKESLHPDASIHDLAMTAVTESYSAINQDSSRIYAAVVTELFQRQKLKRFQAGGGFVSKSHDAMAEVEERNYRFYNQNTQ